MSNGEHPNNARPQFELRQVMEDGSEEIELCSLHDLVERAGPVALSRRQWLGLAALSTTSALIYACSPPPHPGSAYSLPDLSANLDARANANGHTRHPGTDGDARLAGANASP